MTVRGLLLDLDGTLVDHEAAADAGLRAWLPTIGHPATDESVAHWTALQEPHLAAWRAGTITYAEQRRRRLRDFLATPSAPDSELDAIFAGYLKHYEAAWRAYDDVIPALRALPVPCAVLTNGSTTQQNKKLIRTGIAHLIGPVFTVDNLGTAKPDPAAFLRACERWGFQPHEVLSVGDNHDLDVRAARSAGLRATHLDRHGTGPFTEPHRIATLADLTL
ncbi:HAD family hydrolase [Winogradskya consettensis]|uniref:Hydrolase n=1 Tax=Winogradskya consettensis TaxID=113560 RepID=A0A919VYI3_9ACTN|nr:HAD family hydrolase [Actinoplanes consettensis]GIM79480.1 hydrolase [Actinoplanes consettensis]